LLSIKRQVLFLGESGCGKTSIIQNTLGASMNTIFLILFTLSARTSAAQIQDLIECKMLQKRKTSFGPPEGKYAVLLIDDFNLPRPSIHHISECFGGRPLRGSQRPKVGSRFTIAGDVRHKRENSSSLNKSLIASS
jgi:energy-coupling factor transporter ATP-binding protein EcfA2